MRPCSSANHYWCGRLPKQERRLGKAGTGEKRGPLGEVRGDRAGRTPTRSCRFAQNFTTTPSRATELWIGTLRSLPP